MIFWLWVLGLEGAFLPFFNSEVAFFCPEGLVYAIEPSMI